MTKQKKIKRVSDYSYDSVDNETMYDRQVDIALTVNELIDYVENLEDRVRELEKVNKSWVDVGELQVKFNDATLSRLDELESTSTSGGH